MPFHPYYTMKDGFAIVLFLIPFAWFVFFAPDILGHPDNYIQANPQVTPAHIVPEWYFLPFYAILRAIDFNILFIDAKLGGVIFFGGSILILFFLPWLDTSKVRSGNFRPMFKWFYWLFVINFVALTYLGAQPAEGIYVMLAKICTAYYFVHFLVILPVLAASRRPGRCRPASPRASSARRTRDGSRDCNHDQDQDHSRRPGARGRRSPSSRSLAQEGRSTHPAYRKAELDLCRHLRHL